MLKILIISHISLSFLLFSIVCNANIYQWTDKKGTTHFSDKPHPGAIILCIPPEITEKTTPIQPSATSVSPETKKVPIITITHPSDKSTIRDEQGNVTLSIHIEPGMQKDDKIILLVDNQPVDQSQNEMTITLQNIERGEHTIQAQIIHGTDTIVASSPIITFYMHRPSSTPIH